MSERPRDALKAALLFALALLLRVASPSADPPGWLTSSYAPLVDGGWYLASEAAPDDPNVPDSYRRPIHTALARAIFAVAGGVSERTASLPGALPGALVAPALFLALRRAAGRRAALLAGLFAAIDALHVGWSRTPVPYALISLGGVAALGIALRAVGGGDARSGEEPTHSATAGAAAPAPDARGVFPLLAAAALVVLLTLGIKAVALLALVPLAAIAVVRRGARPAAVAGALALLASIAVLTLALHAPSRERLLEYAGDLSVQALARRAAHVLVASRIAVLAPAALLACALAPLLLRGERPAARRALDAACLGWTLAGLALLAVLERPDVPYLLAFWPGVLATAALALDRLARGGAPAPGRPAAAAFMVAFVVALTALDVLGETGWVEWLDDPYYYGPVRFGRTVLAAALVAAALAAVAGRLFAPGAARSTSPAEGTDGAAPGSGSGARATLPPPPGVTSERPPLSPWPRLAALIVLAHLGSQVALLGPLLARPERSLSDARHDLPAILPREAKVGEQFAHTLLLGDDRGARPRYFFVLGDAARDSGEARSLGVTHVALASDRWGTKARAALTTPSGAPVPVGSLYVAGVRVRLQRLPGSSLPPTAFERGRERLDAGDPGAAAALFASAVASAPRSALVRAHLAFARAVAGDADGAAVPLAEALSLAPRSVPALAVKVMLDLRRGAPADALAGVASLAGAIRADRSVERIRDDLAAALAAHDDEAIRALAGKRIELFVGDLLR